MPNQRKRLSASERRSRKKDGERRLKARLNEANDECGKASRCCRQLEDANRTLIEAARSHRGCDRESHHRACPVPAGVADLNLIPSITEIIDLSTSVCLSTRGAGSAHRRHSVDSGHTTSPGRSEESIPYSPHSDGGGPASGSQSPAPVSPGSPRVLTGDLPHRRTSPQVSWPGSPPSSLDD